MALDTAHLRPRLPGEADNGELIRRRRVGCVDKAGKHRLLLGFAPASLAPQ